MSGEAIIEVRGLINRFGTQTVHQDLDLDLYRGEVLGVVGGSGTGKSVLLRSILGLRRATAGSVQVFGETLLELSPERRSQLERRFGVLYQRGALFSSLTVTENIALPLIEHAGLSRAAAERLALEPDILFLDEPTAGLDPIGAAAFDQLILTLRDALGLSVFLVTHDLDTLYTICDRVAVLAEKRVLVADRLDVVAATDNPWIHDYFHGPRGRAAAQAATRVPGSV